VVGAAEQGVAADDRPSSLRSGGRSPLNATTLGRSLILADAVDINGDQPDIIGQVCEALVAIEYSHAGVVVEPANVIFLRFASRWHRLYFDFGIVFWRSSDDGPATFEAEELDASFRAEDIGTRFGLVGRRLEAVRYDTLDDGSRVTLRFDDSRQIRFDCRSDVTTYSA